LEHDRKLLERRRDSIGIAKRNTKSAEHLLLLCFLCSGFRRDGSTAVTHAQRNRGANNRDQK
jgi:hypothetical protein